MLLGSINVDTTYHVHRFPEPGETLQPATDKSSAPGGKGANQAVSHPSRSETYSLEWLARDSEGKFMRDALQEDHIDTTNVGNDPRHGTGTALVTLDENGQNDIMVYGGANQAMTKDVLSKSEEVMKKVDFLITQFKTPQTVALEAFKMAKANGVITVLNPAPANRKSCRSCWNTRTSLLLNETESALLTGIEITDDASLDQTAEYFCAKGVGVTLVTLGSGVGLLLN
ncbi:PfkB family carbohydrate kinase [Limosilactobacillus fermentum]